MKVWTFTVCRNEAIVLPWFLLHYSPFVERMVVFDENSDDGSHDILSRNPKVDLRNWPFKGLDDERFLLVCNEWYKEARGKADFVAMVDADELLHHPDMGGLLSKTDCDILPSTGYALISPSGWPRFDGKNQIYDLVRTGRRQSNYDKRILHRPELTVKYTHGRHPEGGWPKHDGKESGDVGIKLLHLHHVGGAQDTKERNERNYARANDKRFAWSYSAGHNENPEQNGSLAWVRDAIENKKLIDVMAIPDYPTKKQLEEDFKKDFSPAAPKLRKLQFGCGSNHLEGWENFDAEIDLRKPLPFPGGCASFIFAEHVIEHITHKEAWLFLAECWRVLAPGGVVRIAIPDIARIAEHMTAEYAAAVKAGGHGDGSPQSAIKAAVFEHGHQGAWTVKLLEAFLEAIGFKTTLCQMGESGHAELRGVEGHGKIVGDAIARVETGVVEGVKQ